MNPDLPTDAVEFGEAARKAFESLGGVQATRRAEADPSTRGEVAEVLRALGIDDLDPRADADTAAAAAVLCEEAGRVVLPFPIAGMVLRDAGHGPPFACVPQERARVDHGDLFDDWVVVGPDGTARHAAPTVPALGTRLGPFVTDLAVDPEVGSAAAGSAVGSTAAGPPDHDLRARWWLTLSGWTILGGLERALELAVDHTQQRIQFGKPLTAFQVVRFQLADAAVAVAGLRELARFTLWRLDVAPDHHAWPDVLALRSHALDVARTVLRATQQLHGASGLCDELDISILVRHLQPLLRLPEGAEETALRLADAIDGLGFEGLFTHGHGRSS